MNTRNQWFDDLQRNVSELIAKSPAADIERNVKAVMAQAFSRMDLVTREEFDVHKQLLERALARITALESRVSVLEGNDVAPHPAVDDPLVTPAGVPPLHSADPPVDNPSDVPPQDPKA